MVHSPGEVNCKIHKCLTIIIRIYKSTKKTFNQNLHLKWAKDIYSNAQKNTAYRNIDIDVAMDKYIQIYIHTDTVNSL